MKTARKAWKSEEVWLNQEESNKRLDLAVFFIFMIEDNLEKNISLDILFDILK